MFALATLSLFGCGAQGSAFQPEAPTKASGLVYVYRVNKLFGVAVGNDIVIDGVKRGTLRNAGYLTYQLSPGVLTQVNPSVAKEQLQSLRLSN